MVIIDSELGKLEVKLVDLVIYNGLMVELMKFG